jgi:hypothetical protein
LDENGDDHPICYFSKSLLPRERNYSATDREALAIVKAILHFRTYVYGPQEFTVVTDHKANVPLKQLKLSESRRSRWALELQPYNFKIVYREGKKHQNADVLSRMLIPNMSPISTEPPTRPQREKKVTVKVTEAKETEMLTKRKPTKAKNPSIKNSTHEDKGATHPP